MRRRTTDPRGWKRSGRAVVAVTLAIAGAFAARAQARPEQDAGRQAQGEPQAQAEPPTPTEMFGEYYTLGAEALGNRQLAEAISSFEKALDVIPRQPHCAYNLACAYALSGEVAKGLDWLGRAAEWGFFDVQHLDGDGDLTPLRADPRYEVIRQVIARNELAEQGIVGQVDPRPVILGRRQAAAARRRAAESSIHWREGHAAPLSGVRFGPDGSRLLTWDISGRVLLWDALTFELIAAVGAAGKPGSVGEFSNDGRHILVYEPWLEQATLLDGLDGTLIAALDTGDQRINAARFSPKGDRAVTGDTDGRVTLWDTSGPAVSGELKCETPVLSLSFSPDGSLVLILDAAYRVRLWRPGAGEARVLGTKDGTGVMRAWFNAAGDRILASCAGGAPASAAVAGGGGLEFAGEGGSSFMAPIWLLDGARLLAPGTGAGADGSWVIRDAGGAAPTAAPARLEGVGGRGTVISVSRDGRKVFAASPGDAAVFDAATGGRIAAIKGVWATNMLASFSRDGHRLVTVTPGARGSTTRVWNTEKGSEEAEGVLPLKSDRVTALAFAEDGQRLALATDAQAALIWDGRRVIDLAAGTDDNIHVLAHDSGLRPGRGAMSPDGRLGVSFAIARPAEEAAPGCRVWDMATGEWIRDLDVGPGRVRHVQFSPDGGMLLASVGGDDGEPASVRWLDVRTGRVVFVFDDVAGQVSISRDGARCVARSPDRTTTHLLDLDRGTRLPEFGGTEYYDNVRDGDPIMQWAFSADSRVLAMAMLGGRILLVDAATGSPRGELAGHETNIIHLAASSTGPWLVSTSMVDPGETRLWNLETQSCVRVLGGHAGYVRHAAFDAAGVRLVTAGEDPVARLWRLDAESPPVELRGHAGVLHHAAFSPDGRRVITCGDDGTARLWNAETGAAAAVLGGHGSIVLAASFSPDGNRILTTSLDGLTRLWDAATGALLLTRAECRGDAWLAFTPGRHYADHHSAAEWAIVNDVPLSCYERLLRDPEKVAATIAGRAPIAQQELPEVPELLFLTDSGSVENRTVRLELKVDDRSGIGPVELLQDGRPIPAPPVARGAGGRSGRLELTVEIPSSASHTEIEARATNVRGVRSAPQKIRLEYLAREIDLYLVAIAVGDYADDSLDLRYAVKDADDLIGRFQAQQGQLYKNVHVFRQTDGQVSGTAVARLLNNELARARHEDMLLVFVAGHGILSQADEYWFLTRTATPADPFDGIKRQQLWDLVLWDRLLPRRRVLMLDTCHAGVTPETTRGAERPLFSPEDMQRMADDGRGGVYVLAAADKNQFAQEHDGNGLFTAAILEALDGLGDRAPYGDGDGYVSIDEVTDYTRDVVEKRSGGRQTPTQPKVEGGKDFPLARIIAAGSAGRAAPSP